MVRAWHTAWAEDRPGVLRRAREPCELTWAVGNAPAAELDAAGARVCATRSSSRALARGYALRAVLPLPRARVCASRRPLAPSGPWLRGRARSTRFRSRSRPSLGGAGTRLRMRCSCRLRDSQSRAAQGRSVASDGASLRCRVVTAWQARSLRSPTAEWPRIPFGRALVAVRTASRVIRAV
jgi:hypothetical protein